VPLRRVRRVAVRCAMLVATATVAMTTPPAAAQPRLLDPTFGKSGIVRTDLGMYAFPDDLIVLPDRSILVAADSRTGTSTPAVQTLIEYGPNGALDKSFGKDGIVKTSYRNGFYASSVARQRDGKLVVVGNSFDMSNNDYPTLARYTARGALDTGFGTGGIARSSQVGFSGNGIAVQPNGRIVIGTSPRDVGLERWAANGKTLDPTLDGDGIAGDPSDVGGCGSSSQSGANRVALTPGGSIIASGTCGGASSSYPKPSGGIVRYKGGTTVDNGAFDTTFGTGGATIAPFPRPDFGQDLVRLADGRLIQIDQIGYGNVNAKIGLFRTTPNGAIDSTFGSGGSTTFTIARFPYSDPVGLAVAPNHSLVAAAFDGKDDGAFGIARRTPTGAADPTYGTGGQATVKIGPAGPGFMSQSGATALALQPDDRAVVAGTTYRNGHRVITLVRFRAPVDRITNLKIKPKGLSAASSGLSIDRSHPKKKHTHGALVSYVGTEPSATFFSVLRPRPGRLQNGHCFPPSSANAGQKRCTRYSFVGFFEFKDRAGRNHFWFTGRLTGHKLPPGRYSLRAIPHNSGGVGSASFVPFRVKSG
jgi:uncharacterized delta-60 repeat protein